MSESNSESNIPKSFWIISVIALLWNLLGLMAYIMQVTMTDQTIQALPEAERLLYQQMPIWATSAFAIAVNGGVLGCILLLFKKSLAMPVFIVSTLGVIVQMIHSFGIANTLEVYGATSVIMPLVILLISIYLVWYAHGAKSKGWLS